MFYFSVFLLLFISFIHIIHYLMCLRILFSVLSTILFCILLLVSFSDWLYFSFFLSSIFFFIFLYYLHYTSDFHSTDLFFCILSYRTFVYDMWLLVRVTSFLFRCLFNLIIFLFISFLNFLLRFYTTYHFNYTTSSLSNQFFDTDVSVLLCIDFN